MVSNYLVSDEIILGSIHIIKGKRIILHRDLADLYDVDTKQLKRSARRNIQRFPDDFMFELKKKK